MGGCAKLHWEVLNGVGVDGVGVIFPFFHAFFPFFYAFVPLFFAFLCVSYRITAKMGNFTPTPSASTPCKTSRLQGDKTASFCGKMSGREVTGNKSAPQSSIELYDPWISGPLRVTDSRTVSEYCSACVSRVDLLSKQQNCTWTTSSTVLGTPPNRTRTKRFPFEEV